MLHVLTHLPIGVIAKFSEEDPAVVSASLRALADQLLAAAKAKASTMSPVNALVNLAEKKGIDAVEVRFWLRFQTDLQVLKRNVEEFISTVANDTCFLPRVQFRICFSSSCCQPTYLLERSMIEERGYLLR